MSRHTRSGPRLLSTQRQALVLLERARVRSEGRRVVYDQAADGVQRVFNIPFANVAVLMLGQGCSITTEAARLLAEEHVHVAISGTGGTPIHLAAMADFEPNDRMWQMFRVSSDPDSSFEAARSLMLARARIIPGIAGKIQKKHKKKQPIADLERASESFSASVERAVDLSSLLGHEGGFTRAVYNAHRRNVNMPAFKREHGKGASSTREDRANGRIDHGNYLAYGLASACLWTLGIPRGLSIVHGKTRNGALVLDLADVFKDSFVLPHAFAEHRSEMEFREALIADLHDLGALDIAYGTIQELLA